MDRTKRRLHPSKYSSNFDAGSSIDRAFTHFKSNAVTFSDLGLNDKLVDALEWMGITQPTEIQIKAIPLAMQGKDLIGCAQTGTGKTAAFLLPMVDNLMKKQRSGIRCLIIAPTRELALQIDQQLDGLSYFTDVSSIPVYGGSDSKVWSNQKTALREGVNIMIGTPGRLLSHMNLGYMDLSQLELLVLDEADRMLDMGFVDDILRITAMLPKNRQTLMFSATMDQKIRGLAKKMLKEPEEVNVAIAKPAAGINQQIYLVYDNLKVKLLQHLIATEEVSNMIVFASRKTSVDTIDQTLQRMGLSCKSIHSGREQNEREELMRQFKSGHFKILIATDILSRGIDIDGLSHVVNYDMPEDAADYVHRIGRTARASSKGCAISFINPDDQYKLIKVEKLIERSLEKLPTPPEIGESPTWNDNAKKPPRNGGKSGGKQWNKRKPKSHQGSGSKQGGNQGNSHKRRSHRKGRGSNSQGTKS